MLVKFYSLSSDAVLLQLMAAQARSYDNRGSHDNSCEVVIVDGELLKARSELYAWTSVQDSFSRPTQNELVIPAEPKRFASIYTRLNVYGGNCRSRAGIKIFIKDPQTGLFDVVDLMEVDLVGDYPTDDLVELFSGLLFRAQKKFKFEVEVGGENEKLMAWVKELVLLIHAFKGLQVSNDLGIFPSYLRYQAFKALVAASNFGSLIK